MKHKHKHLVPKAQRLAASAALAGFMLVIAVPPAVAADTESWPIALRTVMKRLANVEWRLHEAAGQTCPREASATGLTIDDLGSYNKADRTLLTASLGLSALPQVAVVAAGSPAERAGIREFDEIVAIDDTQMATLRDATDAKGTMAERVEEMLAALPADHPAMILLHRKGEEVRASLTPLRRCGVRFVLKTEGGIDAYSDDDNLAVTARFVDFTKTDDEIALVAGHELGHVIALDRDAKSIGQRRSMEDRADILGVELASCAGYDIEKGLEFWRRFNQRDWLRWFRDPSHRNVPERIRRMQAHPAPASCPVSAIPALQPD
ncbi:hypothetical protein ACLIMP_05675 [Novosphingobium aerophilum]|uniref:hypothetical protein n=1 Tax=Novosphingobium aerophilum TaxID=2839843 RepID=UPI003FD2EF58